MKTCKNCRFFIQRKWTNDGICVLKDFKNIIIHNCYDWEEKNG